MGVYLPHDDTLSTYGTPLGVTAFVVILFPYETPHGLNNALSLPPLFRFCWTGEWGGLKLKVNIQEI